MYISGRKPILEALEKGASVEKIYLLFGTHGSGIEQLKGLARKLRVPITEWDKKKFLELESRELAGEHAQGVIALIADRTFSSLEDFFSGENSFLVALDGITDPHNAGAIIRSAECFGADGVIIPTSDSAPINDVVVKTSAGAALRIPIAKVGNLAQSLREAKENKFWTIGTAGDGDKTMYAEDLTKRVVIVIGAEGDGMRPGVRKECDVVVSIPIISSGVGSLNASVAAGVVMAEVVRQRSTKL